MVNSTARIFSIAGHPAVLMPAAAIVASAGANTANAMAAVALAAACGLLVLAYSYYKTKRGDWTHIDASAIDERAQLNTRLGAGLVAIAGVLAVSNVHVAIFTAVALSGLIVLAAHVLRRVAKLSLHLAFATFATLIVWPQYIATVILLLVALAVGWSRLVLRRHVGRDLVWGASVGALAGLVFQVVRTSIDV